MTALRVILAAACFAAGVVAADRAALPAAGTVVAGAGGPALLALAWLLHRGGHPRPLGAGDPLPGLRPAVVLALAVGLAAVAFATTSARIASYRRALPMPADGTVSLLGSVASDAVTAGRAQRFALRVRRAGGEPVRALVSVRAFGLRAPPGFGDVVRVSGTIRAVDPRDRFGARLHRRWISAEVSAAAPGVRVVSRTPNPVLRAANLIRGRMEAMARDAPDPAGAGLLLGLVVGDERLVPERVGEDFRDSGLSHLLAVSGANVAMVLGAVLLALRTAGASRRAQVLAGLATAAFFAVVTRWEPSVLRATLMASAALCAFLAGRRSDTLHGLGLAFVALLAADPFLLWSVGFQLSFAATFGILVGAPPLLSVLRRLPRPVAQALAAGTAAQAAVAPLLALHFGRLSLVAVPANLAAFPLVAPATLLGMASAAAAAISPSLGIPAFRAGSVVASWIGRVARAAAGLPHASVAVPGTAGLLAGCLGLAVATLAWSRGRRWARWLFALALGLPALGLLLAPRAHPPPGGLRLTFLDVGQGDAALVESPSGARVLVDGGPEQARVATRLRRRGIRRLDVVVFSHPHADHVAGLGEVLARLDAGLVLHPGTGPLPPEARRAGRVEVAAAGASWVVGDLRIDVLGPDATLRAAAGVEPGVGAREGSAVNDASVVARIGWGSGCALFPGDLEEEGQRSLLASRPRAVDCTVLKAPHHGSARLLPEFVRAVDPEWVAVSVGRNDYGHPSRTAIELFLQAGGRVLRTDRLGPVVLEMGGGGTAAPAG